MAEFTIRPATAADAPIIARHRAEMFTDMGVLPSAIYQSLVDETVRYLERAMPAGEYLGWLAAPGGSAADIVAGAGVQRRRVLPHPSATGENVVLASGRQAIVLNVFTEPAWRRRGLARLLMAEILGWARSVALDTLVLHASDAGRPLYEELGFDATNEMRLRESLIPDR